MLRLWFRRKLRLAGFLGVTSLLACVDAAAQSTSQHLTTQTPVKLGKMNTGRIEISTATGGYPILIDGYAAGETAPTEIRMVELQPGSHTVEIILPNGRRWSRQFNVVGGRRQCVKLSFHPKQPCSITIAGPDEINDGGVLNFQADVKSAPGALAYNWSVTPSSARIISGEGTSSITVDTTGLGAQKVTALLTINDGVADPNCQCRQSAVRETTVRVIALPAPNKPRRFDEFPATNFDDVKARLDNLAIELQSNPTSTAYIYVYSGPKGGPREADRIGARARDYLVEARGISRDRVVVKNSGRREKAAFELFIVPAGSRPSR